MSILQYLQLQPVEPTDDGTTSPLDDYQRDDVIDLNDDIDEEALEESWTKVLEDLDEDPDKLSFSEK